MSGFLRNSGVLLVLLSCGIACTPPPEAPAELSDLVRYLHREYDNEDPAIMEAGVEQMVDFLAGVDLEAARGDRSFELKDVRPEDVGHLRDDGVDPRDAVGVAVSTISDWDIDCHAGAMILEDQLPFEPTASRYDRSFIDPEDPSCFADGSCAVMLTENDVRRANILYTVDFILNKKFRWIAITDEGEATGRMAFVACSWLDQVWPGENGNTEIRQSYTVDMWMEAEDGRTMRMQTLHTESVVAGSNDEDLVRGTVTLSIDDQMSTADRSLEDICGS